MSTPNSRAILIEDGDVDDALDAWVKTDDARAAARRIVASLPYSIVEAIRELDDEEALELARIER